MGTPLTWGAAWPPLPFPGLLAKARQPPCAAPPLLQWYPPLSCVPLLQLVVGEVALMETFAGWGAATRDACNVALLSLLSSSSLRLDGHGCQAVSRAGCAGKGA